MSTFELYRDRTDRYCWRLLAPDGTVMAVCEEGYFSKAAARLAISFIQRDAPEATIQDLTD